MGSWPDSWTRDPPDRADGSARPSRLPPELDPRGNRPAPGRARTSSPGSPAQRTAPPPPPPPPPPRQRRRRRRRGLGRLLLALLLVVVGFVVVLALWAMSRLERVDALSGRAGTAGTTWLLVGSDSREGLTREEQNDLNTGSTEGRRTDTIILLHDPAGRGAPTLVSLPRDSLVEIPGRGPGKLNSAFAAGGAPLLVDTVEQATGLTVDSYVEVGFGGVVDVVDAVGGIPICVEQPIQDERAGLDVPAGCQEMDGGTALSYVRARYFDPTGDLGRIQRQQEFLGSMIGQVFRPGLLLNPIAQVRLARAGADAVVVDESAGPIDLARLAWTFRSVTGGDGVLTTVPVADPDYRVDGAGSTVLWDDEAAAQLFADLEAGRPVAPPDR